MSTMMMSHAPWLWLVLALALMSLEVVVPGLHFLWFGVAAAAVALLAWLGLEAAILLLTLNLTTMVAAPIAELMQQTGGLEPTPFARATWAALSLVGLQLIGGGLRKFWRSRHPWWPLLGLLLVGVLGFLLLLGIWMDGEEPPGGLVVFLGTLCLCGTAVVAPAIFSTGAQRWVVGQVKAEWNRGGWAVTTVLAFSLCCAAPAGLVASWVALSAEGHDDESPDGPWITANGFAETLRLLLAEAAYDQVGYRPERRIPGMEEREGIRYSATPAARTRQYQGDRWTCYADLTVRMDPSHPTMTSRDFCVERLRRAGHPEPEWEADKRVDKTCDEQRDDPVLLYSKACTNAIKDIQKGRPRFELPEPIQSEPDRWALRRCIQSARQSVGRDSISAREWRAIELRADGADYAEIAEELGMLEANARQVVSRARLRLQALCGELY